MNSSNTSRASKPRRTLSGIFPHSIRVAAKHFPDFLNDAYTSYSLRPVHPSRARIRRVELRKDKSGQRIIRRSPTLYVHEYTTLPAAGPVDVTQPQLDFPPWSRDATVPPTLFHLAAAASLLEKLQPEYIVPERQCFWYTAMLYYALVGPDALDADIEGRAKRVTFRNAYRPETFRGTAVPVTNKRTFRNLFQRVTRKDIQELCTDEELDAIAFQTRLVNLYGGLRDAMWEDRERFGRWGPLASPDENAVIDALGGILLDMQLEVDRAVARRKREAERIATTIQREAERAQFKAETAAAIRELEAEAAAAARELEAQNTAAIRELKAAAARELEAERARGKADTAAAKEKQEAIAAECKQTEERLAALREEHAATLARVAELGLQVAFLGVAPSNAA